MNAALTAALGLALTLASLRGELIAQWDFNGTNSPSLGSGTALLIGGVSAVFATGSTNDPVPSSSNRAWNTSAYPGQGIGNKTAGFQFDVSTLGFTNVSIRWDHRVSSTASKYCRVQYSADGLRFQDAQPPITAQAVSSSGTYFETKRIELPSAAGVDNNPHFAFRIVSEFEKTATRLGIDGYVATYATNHYSPSGTIRIDMVEVSGNPIPGANTPPRISPIENQTLRSNESTPVLPFTIADDQDPPQNLVMEGFSSDQAVLPDVNLVFGGWGADRSLTAIAGSIPGSSIISLTVTDTEGRSATTTFSVTVLPTNTPPMISGLRFVHSLMDTPAGPFAFSVADRESPAERLTVFAWSSNPDLLPNDDRHLTLSGNGSNRTLVLVPAPGQTGVAPIHISVSDGTSETTSVFPFLITPAPEVVLYEPFSYPCGSLLTNSGALWGNRSGTLGECQVTNGQLQIRSDQTEDVVAPLIGGPFARTNGVVLYASFRLNFLSVPKTRPDYFAHFVGGTSLRARVYASASTVLPGCFCLAIANGSNTNTPFPANLRTNSWYTIVTRYHIDRALATLWVNPVHESDANVTATDVVSSATISGYGFREDSALGAAAYVDDLKVGLSFNAVVADAARKADPLYFKRAGDAVVLQWSESGFVLQSAGTCRGPFTNVPGAASPYTNRLFDQGERFFRLRSF